MVINATTANKDYLTPTYGLRSLEADVPRHALPKKSMPARAAYSIIHDELMLDGNSRLNMATFVTTWMEPEAIKLMEETFDKNMIDKDEYPQTAEVEDRCVNILSRLYHAPNLDLAVGVSTTGSSEAIMLAGLALKWRWRQRRQVSGLSIDKPNLVLGSHVQVVWEKFCRYWDVEPRYVPIEANRCIAKVEDIKGRIDENTIGVCAILGTTFTGQFDPIAEIDAMLTALKREQGLMVPMHVDAASGGFVAPFIHPSLRWDFRLTSVHSINVSGHKYGLVYPGVGWALWRSQECLPEDLVFHVNYLGGNMPTFTLNFSRPGNQILAQYYNFLRLGHEGYKRIMMALRDTALYLSKSIKDMGPFDLLSKGEEIPVFAFRLKPGADYTVFDLSDRLRQRGWVVPAYTMPANIENMAVLRIVVREGFSHDMADMLIDDIRKCVEYFKSHPPRSNGATHYSANRTDHKIC